MEHTDNGHSNIDDDELIRLVSSSSDSANQFVVFTNSQKRYYAINVAKVEELIVYNAIRLVPNSDPKALPLGTAKIRRHMMPIVLFDRWLNLPELQDSEYELVILCHYGHQRFGIVIHSVAGIYNINAADLVDNSARDEKTSYITELSIGNNKELCLVFDSERLLADLFPELQQTHEAELQTIQISDVQSSGTILIAEDSKIVQKKLLTMLEKMGLQVHTFLDGEQLWQWLNSHTKDPVSLIISDVEMPVMDGISLLKKCKNHPFFKQIPFMVHTNMANPAIIKTAQELGADSIIKKIDFQTLQREIKHHIQTAG